MAAQRFALEELLEARRKGFPEGAVAKHQLTPKTLSQIHEDAATAGLELGGKGGGGKGGGGKGGGGGGKGGGGGGKGGGGGGAAVRACVRASSKGGEGQAG